MKICVIFWTSESCPAIMTHGMAMILSGLLKHVRGGLDLKRCDHDFIRTYLPRPVQKFCSRLKKLFLQKWRRSKFFMNMNARFHPVVALLSSTVTYMHLSLQKCALSHQVLLLRTVMFETITCNFSSCLRDKFYRAVSKVSLPIGSTFFSGVWILVR